MRTFFVKIMLLPISLWAACTNTQKQVKDFIPGTYVNHAQSAYSIADDTLQIMPDALTENSYHVVRKTGFSRVLNGQLQAPQHQVKSFTGVWNVRQQTMQLTANGVILQFLPDSSELRVENSTYHKIREGL
jgi:hypothetical protein